MKRIIQKFGGTSLKDDYVREKAIEHICQARDEGYQVVVVVSAMGRKGAPYATDTFLDWIQQNGNHLSPREKDLLLSTGEMISSTTLTSLLNARGAPAVALTGLQAGIYTNEEFGQAQIESINPTRINEELDRGNVVVVCGFQGGTKSGEITTLGRGGSDTTATALGLALKAEVVDIYTDVEGIMTADPRIVEDASFIKRMTYTEICNMAQQGAKVIHPRAVEIAMQGNIPIRVRSTVSHDPGTLVTSRSSDKEIESDVHDRAVTGIAHVRGLTQMTVFRIDDDADFAVAVFQALAKAKISVDFINIFPDHTSFTVPEEVADRTASIIRSAGYEPQLQRSCAKVSAIGAGMAGLPGVMARIVSALRKENIDILQSADSHTTIWVLVREDVMTQAVKALHREFQLHTFGSGT